MDRILLRKLAPVIDPRTETAKWSEYVQGSLENVKSLPVAYSIKGYLFGQIIVGQPVKVLRTERNGIALPGHFCSTPVEFVGPDTFATANSVYWYEILPGDGKEVALAEFMRQNPTREAPSPSLE